MKKKYDLSCEFDIKKHKEVFINYFEAVISPEGKVIYAVPSHQEKLIEIACKKEHLSRYQFNKSVPKEEYFNMIEYLCRRTGYVSCWFNYIVGTPNDNQQGMIDLLKAQGVMI